MAIPEGYKALAKIGFAYKGEYTSGTNYNQLDAVYYLGSTYVALIDNPVGVPNNDGVNWRYLAQGSGGTSGGDMLKSVYDLNNNGIVDNAEKLGGQLPSYYQPKTDSTLKTTSKTTTGAINEVSANMGALKDLETTNKTSVVEAVNEVHGSIPEMLDTMEEVDANTEAGKSVDSLVVKQLNNSLANGAVKFKVENGELYYSVYKE